MSLPRVAIVLVTYSRTALAVATVRSVSEHLKYEGETAWYVGDDGSPYEHTQAILDELDVWKQDLIGVHNEDFTPGTYHCGPNWNLASKKALEWADIVLWLEDDWRLLEPLDITPYVRLLNENKGVGMVRLGLMPINLELYSHGHFDETGEGRIYFSMSSRTHYAYSGNPHLYHRRFRERYGDFAIDKNPGELEVDYDNRIRAIYGEYPCQIWYPLDLGGVGHTYGFWGHGGTEKSYE